MKEYKVIIVDDDEISIDNLTLGLKRDKRFCLVSTAKNGKQAKKIILKYKPDLLFLDVELPDIIGINLLRELHDSIIWNMKVIFYTFYDKYMLDAIRESTFDYLLKPFEEKELKCILDRYINLFNSNNANIQLPNLFKFRM